MGSATRHDEAALVGARTRVAFGENDPVGDSRPGGGAQQARVVA